MLTRIGGADGWAALQADVCDGLNDGRYDRRDMPVVITALKRWLM